MLRTSGIYKIFNRITGEIYIGSTARNFRERWGVHRKLLRRGTHPNRHLLAAYRKFGLDVFEFAVLEELPPGPALFERELFHIDCWWDSGTIYNIQHVPTRRVQTGAQ